MHNHWFHGWVICLLILSVGLPVWRHVGMNMSLTVAGAGSYPVRVSDDRVLNGGSVARLRQVDGESIMSCELELSRSWPDFCSLHIALGRVPDGINLSRYAAVKLDIWAQGPGVVPVVISLRNYGPAYYRHDNANSLKANVLVYTPASNGHALEVPLDNFHVATWWIQEYHVPLQHARPDLSNVVSLDVTTDFDAAPGHYAIGVRSIVFYGKWISRTTMLVGLVVLWWATAMVFLLAGFWRARQAAFAAVAGRRQLQHQNVVLTRERRQLERVASHDPLTKVFNRAGFRPRLMAMIARVRRENSQLSVVFIDVDHFKAINDGHGHEVGDECLATLAQRLGENIRNDDIVCRWGGEEFVLACADAPLSVAAARAERLRGFVSESQWPGGVSVTCSFGVVEMHLGEGFDNLLRRADDALYMAKRAGRNCVRSGRWRDGAAAKP